MNIQQRVKSLLEQPGWTQEILSTKSGVSQPVISRLVNNKQRGVHSTTLEKLIPFLPAPEPDTGVGGQ